MLGHRAHVITFLGALLIAGCGGDDDGSGNLDCSDFTACGGDPVGEWTFIDACLDAELDPDLDNCPEATATIENVAVDGTATVEDDGTFAVDFTTTGDVVLMVPESCRGALTCAQISDAAGVDCADNDDGGCDCEDHIEDTTQESGTWEVDGDSFVTTTDGADPEEAPFCVQGDVLKLQPPPEDAGGPEITLVMTRG
jgi:hypothetical protein